MKRRQGEKYKKIKPEQEVFPVFWRIVIIAYILLMLYSLFNTEATELIGILENPFI